MRDLNSYDKAHTRLSHNVYEFYEYTWDTWPLIILLGTETTASSLSWFLLYMISHPQVQEKIQEEIDSLVEREGCLPQLSDKPDLPYTAAVTLEVMRLQTVAPLAFPHSASRKTFIQGKAP